MPQSVTCNKIYNNINVHIIDAPYVYYTQVSIGKMGKKGDWYGFTHLNKLSICNACFGAILNVIE